MQVRYYVSSLLKLAYILTYLPHNRLAHIYQIFSRKIVQPNIELSYLSDYLFI